MVDTAAFSEVVPQRSADAVFSQVRSQIVAGSLEPGQLLPGERELSTQLGVSRGVVREALQRLAQAGLVDIRHGGSTRVLDYRTSTDLGLLQHMLVRPDSSLDIPVLRSLLEMRISIGVAAAGLAAKRATLDQQHKVRDLTAALEIEDDVLKQQDIDLEFWSVIVNASGNLAYRIAYNGLVATYRPLRGVIASVVVPELLNVESHRALAASIAVGDIKCAEAAARELLESSESQWQGLLDSLTEAPSA